MSLNVIVFVLFEDFKINDSTVVRINSSELSISYLRFANYCNCESLFKEYLILKKIFLRVSVSLLQ